MTDRKVILALDLGTTTGFAVQLDGDMITSGWWSFKPQRFEGGGMRYLRFQQKLNWMYENSGGIDEVYFEEVRRHKGVDAAHVYGGLLAVLTSWCEAHSVPYSGIPVGTIKKHATGRGNAGKEDMMNAAAARGWTCDNDDECDAMWLLDYVLCMQEASV